MPASSFLIPPLVPTVSPCLQHCPEHVNVLWCIAVAPGQRFDLVWLVSYLQRARARERKGTVRCLGLDLFHSTCLCCFWTNLTCHVCVHACVHLAASRRSRLAFNSEAICKHVTMTSSNWQEQKVQTWDLCSLPLLLLLFTATTHTCMSHLFFFYPFSQTRSPFYNCVNAGTKSQLRFYYII